MPERTRVLVIGPSCLDILLFMNELPDAGKITTGPGYRFAAGGSGTLSALMLARLDMDAILCTRIARDANGTRLNDFLVRNKIDTRFVTFEPRGFTGLDSIIITASESNRTIVYEGANNQLSEEDVESAMTCFPDAVLLNLSVPERVAIAASEFARSQGIPLFTTTGNSVPKPEVGRLARSEVFIASEDAVAEYTGITDFKQNTMVKAFISLANVVDAKYYVIKLKNGNTYISDNMILRLYTQPSATQVNDPSTAFDAFSATLTAEYLRRKSIERATKFATIVENMTQQGEGASRSLPRSVADIQKFISENEIDFKL